MDPPVSMPVTQRLRVVARGPEGFMVLKNCRWLNGDLVCETHSRDRLVEPNMHVAAEIENFFQQLNQTAEQRIELFQMMNEELRKLLEPHGQTFFYLD